jgi:sulfur dioxygenase
MFFRQLFDRSTCTYTYLLADSDSGEAVLIDPVAELAERDLGLLSELGFTLVASIETHVHADHVTGAWALKQATGCQIVYPAAGGVKADRLVGVGDTIAFGQHSLEVRPTPGHTAGCTSYVAEGCVFTGDALMVRGCGRTDFQEGDPATLFDSVWTQILSLPDETVVYPGHDYKGRTASTVAEEKAHNPRLGGGKTVEQFTAIMNGLGLAYPARIHLALPGNKRLGKPFSWTQRPRAGSGAPQCTIDWVADNSDGVRLVDVREPAEFEGPLGHIHKAELVPLGTVAEAAEGWSRDEPVVLICRRGGRSDRAALTMEAMGFQRVASMTGGMESWAARS